MKIPYQRRSAAGRSGFSLAELMVVIVILGLIATIVVPNLLDRLTFAQKKKAIMDISAIESAVDTYAIVNNGRYPESLEILVTPDQNGQTFLKSQTKVPVDPWGNTYGYEPPSAGRPYRIYSFGKDGVSGGEGEDADIDNMTARNEGAR